MSYRCAVCHRPLGEVKYWNGGNAIGPECAQKMGILPQKRGRLTKPKWHKPAPEEQQMGMDFGEQEQ